MSDFGKNGGKKDTMMKRLVGLVLVLSLLLCGCGGKKDYVADSVVNTAPGAAEEPLAGAPGRIDVAENGS